MAELVRVHNCEDRTRRGDVVFVHGLNGNPRQYWFPPGEPDKYWPSWLGEDLPDVGVWALGYENAALKPRRLSVARLFLQGGFAMPLTDRANNVLLRLESDGIGERPLVFIVHSMGGLLVKQMLRTANESPNPRWRAILEQTRGVCFVATPHIGADLAKWAIYFRTLLGTNVSVDDLKPHHPYLRDLNAWYRNFVSQAEVNIKTLSFYEMKPLPKVGLVVEPGDADPGIPHAGLHPLDEDHVSICKPKSRHSLLHMCIIDFIRRDCLRPPGAHPHASRSYPPESQPITAAQELPSTDTAQSSSSTDFIVSSTQGRDAINRVSLVMSLSRFSPSDFATLVTAIQDAASHVSRHGTVSEQAAELVRWAEGPTGPGLAIIKGLLRNFRNARRV